MQLVNWNMLTVKGYWHRVRQRKWIVLIAMLLSTTIAVAVALTTTPVYLTTATLIAEAVTGRNIPMDMRRFPFTEAIHIELVRQRLMSYTLLMEVARALNLCDYLKKKESGKTADAGVLSSLKESWSNLLGRFNPRESKNKLTDAQIVQYLRSIISIKIRPSRLEINVMHSDPQLAMDAANQLARTYVNDTKRRRMREIIEMREFIDEELVRAQVKFEQSEQALRNAKKSGGAGPARLRIQKEASEEAYASLLKKRYDADFLTAAERREIGKIAEVLDPAFLPERPIKPRKQGIIAIGILIGLGLGLILLLMSGFIDLSRSQAA